MSSTKVVAWLAVVLLVSTAGCGASNEAGDSQSAASIAGSAAPSGTGAAAEGQAANAADPNHPQILIDTSLGKITVALDADKAPLTVENFLSYVDQGFYDQTIFHQSLKDYVILGGAFTSDLKEKQAGLPVRNEAHNGLKNTRGTIAMARLPNVIDSATCQFFIDVTDNPALDYRGDTADTYGYCAFGKITDGMEVADQIANIKVQDQGDFEKIPVKTVMINSIRRVR